MDDARNFGTERADEFERLLTAISEWEHSEEIDSWTRSQIQVKPRTDSIPQAYAYADFGLKLHEGTTNFTVNFNSRIIEALDLVRMLTSHDGVILEKNEWKLSDSSYDELRESVDSKAYFILKAEAERYAEVLAKSEVQPTECSWEFSEIRWEVADEDCDLSTPQVKLGITERCTFEIS